MTKTFEVPDTIPLSKVRAVLADLGIEADPRDIREVVIGMNGVYVELVALDASGTPYFTPGGDEIAVHQISMRLDPTA